MSPSKRTHAKSLSPGPAGLPPGAHCTHARCPAAAAVCAGMRPRLSTALVLILCLREEVHRRSAGSYGDGSAVDTGPKRACGGHSRLAGRPTRQRTP